MNELVTRRKMIKVTEEFKPTGDCFRNAGRVAMLDSSWTLCHGWIHGQQHLEGKTFEHAWLEREIDGLRIARDLTHETWLVDLHEFPADFYRAVAGAYSVVEYDHEEVLIMLTSYGHWGPWDDKTEY